MKRKNIRTRSPRARDSKWHAKRARKEIPPKFEANQTSMILAIVWAIMMLIREGKRQSIKAIQDKLNVSTQASAPTVRKYLGLLKRWGVIWEIEKSGKGQGKGKSIFYGINPLKLPEYIWLTPVSTPTLWRYSEEMVEANIARKTENAEYYFNAEKVLDLIEPSLTKAMGAAFRIVGQLLELDPKEIDDLIAHWTEPERLKESLNGYKIETDEFFLFPFHVFLVMQFVFYYDEFALYQNEDVLNIAGMYTQ